MGRFSGAVDSGPPAMCEGGGDPSSTWKTSITVVDQQALVNRVTGATVNETACDAVGEGRVSAKAGIFSAMATVPGGLRAAVWIVLFIFGCLF